MGLPEPVQIQVVALKPVSYGAFAWRRGGALTATVVVKATFGLVPDGPARLVAPLPLVAEDTYSSASGSLVEPTDLAPYLPCAGVVLWAHAHASQPVPAMTVRLGVFRGEARLIDKRLHVFGDRALGAAPQPAPFQGMPIVYERTYGGSGFPDNPAGTGATAEARALPNVVHPASPTAPAGFGPVSRHWASRRRLAGSLDTKLLDRPGPDVPDGLDYRYFHPAPADQQCDFLQGDEWIVLDGMHPALPRLSTRLPSVRAQARWVSLAGSHPAEPRNMSLAADTLLVDVERRLCSLVWRGCIALDPADAAAGVVVYTGVEIPGYPIVWPEDVPAQLVAPPAAAVAPPLQVLVAHPVEIQDSSTVQAAPARPTEEGEVTAPHSAGVAARVALSGLPFKNPASSDPAPHFPPPPSSRPSPGGLGTTAPAGVVSPFASGLPFKTAGHAPPPPPSSPGLPPPPVPPPSPWAPVAPPSQPARAARSAWDDEEEGHTRTIDADALEAHRRAWTAPFALAEPGAKAPAPAPSLPGAPWSVERASPVAAAEPEMETHVTTVEQLAEIAASRAAQAAEPPVEAPAPAVAPPALVAPPLVVLASHLSAASPEPVAVEAPPDPSTHATPAAPAETAPPEAPPASAPAPVEPDASSSLRATVKARLAAREPLLDLDLAGADLQDLDLTGASLARANLSGARLARCKLAGARLAGAQLAGADLTGADLEGADLGHADLSRATLAQAHLDGALLEDANLSGAQGQGASLRGARAARASFARGQWDEASFAGADAPQADFTAASLARAHFEGTTLAEARFADARGPGAVFDEARLGQARVGGAAFQGASFRSADARGSVWEKATLDEASFAGAILANANLSRASCARASFAGADLAGANLQRLVGDGADLAGAKLRGADLRQARLADAKLEGAVLTDIVATKADLSRARLARADLTGATLRGARLAGAGLAHANLEGADLRDAELEGANLFGASRKTAKLGTGARGFVEVDPGEDPGSAVP